MLEGYGVLYNLWYSNENISKMSFNEGVQLSLFGLKSSLFDTHLEENIAKILDEGLDSLLTYT